MNISYNDQEQSPSNQNPASPSSSLREPAHSRDGIPECERLRQLRIEYGLDENDDTQDSVLRAILEADDRESRQNNSSHVNSTVQTQTEESTRAAPQSSTQRTRRIWDTCQTAPSRPGVIRIDTADAHLNIGTVDEAAIYTRRVEAIHTIQQNLHRRIGRIIERSELEGMRQQEEEGESRMNALDLLRPNATVWDVPDDLQRREVIEPPLPHETPLPLPESLTRVDRSHQLVRGVSVIVQEDGTMALESPLAEDEVIVRCYKNDCRSALRVNMNTGLVICPHCRTFSPAADVINVRR